MCDLSPNTISLIERGVGSPSVATLHRLTIALGVPITSFFEGENEKKEAILTRAGKRPYSKSASVLLENLGLQNQTWNPLMFAVVLHLGERDAGHALDNPSWSVIDPAGPPQVAGVVVRYRVGEALEFDAG